MKELPYVKLVNFPVSSRKETDMFEKMYSNYDRELGLYSARLRENPITSSDFLDMYLNAFLKKLFIVNREGVVIGFCLLGFGDNTHPDTNYYIAEFYIVPEYRRAGYGLAAVAQLLAWFPGKYCYHVLKENQAGLAFWKGAKAFCGWADLPFSDTLGLDDCFFFAFETKKMGVLYGHR